MRDVENEVASLSDIYEIFRVCDTLHLGIKDDDHPYVVPVAYGVEMIDGKIVLYVSSEAGGKKNRLLSNNPKVSVEVEIVYEYYATNREVKISYASAIATGIVQLLDKKDYDYAMDLIQIHYGYEGFKYDKDTIQEKIFYKIELEDVSGKLCIRKPVE